MPPGKPARRLRGPPWRETTQRVVSFAGRYQSVAPRARRGECLACSWLPPRWEWVDPLKDARAEIEQIEAGLKSRTQAIAERGVARPRAGLRPGPWDAEQVDAEIAADKARERALGLTFGKAPVAAAEVPADPPEELATVSQG